MAGKRKPDSILTPADVKEARGYGIKLGRLARLSTADKQAIKQGLEEIRANRSRGAQSNPTDWQAEFDALRSKVAAFIAPHPKKPKGGKTPKAKKNLDEIAEAADLAGEFQGAPADQVVEINEPSKQRDDFAHLGWMLQGVYHPAYDVKAIDQTALSKAYDAAYNKSLNTNEAWAKVASDFGVVLLVFDFEGDEIRLTSSADRKQLYFVGGNQGAFVGQLKLFKADSKHDSVDLGDMVSLTYSAKKVQAGDKEERPYYHIFGEEGGTAPRGAFDALNKRLRLSGGTYHLGEAERGIIN